MLKQMRTGAKSPIVKGLLFGLLLAAMGGLAIMDVYGMFSNSGANRNYVAELNGQKLSAMEFDRMLQGQIRSQNISTKDAWLQGIPQQLLAQEINTRLFARAVYDMGLRPDNKTVAGEIKRQLKPLVKNGEDEKEILRKVLGNMGMSEKQFVQTLKNQMAGDMLMKAIVNNASVPELLVKTAAKAKHEMRAAEYFAIRTADIAKVGEPTDAQVQATYEQLKSAFMKPEYRSFSYVVLDKETLGVKTEAITDADVKAYYDSHLREFQTAAGRSLEQAIARSESDAQKIIDAVKSGMGIKDAVVKADVKANHLPKTDYTEKGLPAELASVAFKAAAGDVVGPVKTDFGYHVIAVGGDVPASTKSFDSVKADLKKRLEKDGGANALYDKANQIDEALSDGKKLADIAGEYKLSPKTVTMIDATGKTADGKAVTDSITGGDKIVENVFALENGETTQLIDTGKTGFVVAEVQNIIPAAAEPLDKIRDKVVSAWKDMESDRILTAKADEIRADIKSGKTLAEIAKAQGKNIVKVPATKRDGTVADFPRGLKAVLFAMDKTGETVVVPAEKGEIAVMTMTDRHIDAKAAIADADIKALQKNLTTAMQNDLLDQYGVYLAGKYDAKLYPEVLERLYGPKAEDFQ